MHATVGRLPGHAGRRSLWEVWLIVEYEFARRRYSWSKRLNWVAIVVAIAIGVVAIVQGVLTYLDWQWLNDHFGQGGSSRWTQEVIAGFMVRAILLFAVGGLGIATFALGFLKVRKALDDDNHDAIKRWSLMTGIVGVLPGVALGGLLELFIWRAHVSEKFTIFGLLGSAPEAPPEPPSAMVIAQQQASQDEARRKEEYAALFGGSTPAPAPAPQQSMASAYASDSGMVYGAPEAPAPQPEAAAAPPGAAAASPEAAAAPPEAAAASPEAAPAERQPTQFREQPGEAPVCTCGRPMEWIAEYGRYYCYTDDRYEGEA